MNQILHCDCLPEHKPKYKKHKMIWSHGIAIISKKTRMENCVTYLREKWIHGCANVYKTMKKLDSTVRACQFDVFSIKSSMLLEQKKFIWGHYRGRQLETLKRSFRYQTPTTCCRTWPRKTAFWVWWIWQLCTAVALRRQAIILPSA